LKLTMRIDHLSLTNFRNYSRLEIDFPPGATLLHGANAQGKTNLLEAIYYLATARSPHAEHDHQLINWEAGQEGDPIVVGRLTAQVATADEARQIELRLIREEQQGQATFRREALVDRRKVRLMDLLGKIRVVLFLPEDVALVNATPAQRRRYLDVTLCQVDPVYCRTLSSYNKLLEQRNALLRRIAELGQGRDVLPIFTEQLVEAGGQLFFRRARFLSALAREAQRIHFEQLTNGRESIRLGYLPRLQSNGQKQTEEEATRASAGLAEWMLSASSEQLAGRFAESLAGAYEADLARGSTTQGPHRDDWRFWVNGRDLASFGSRGQQRSAILALKLGEIHWMVAETGETPVLLLDEVLAELDEQRRALLLAYVRQSSQAILTATDPGMFTSDFLRQSTTMLVSSGRVQIDAVRAS
jgi:DNA replication and repair protein RecF